MFRQEKKKKKKNNFSSLNNIKIINGYPLFKTFNKPPRPINYFVPTLLASQLHTLKRGD